MSSPLPSSVSASTAQLSRSELAALVRADQFRRWQEGEPTLVEAYLDQCQALREDSDTVLELVCNEIALREQKGESPQLKEYVERFPEYGSQLERRLSLHRAAAQGSLTEIVNLRPADPTAVYPDPGTRSSDAAAGLLGPAVSDVPSDWGATRSFVVEPASPRPDPPAECSPPPDPAFAATGEFAVPPVPGPGGAGATGDFELSPRGEAAVTGEFGGDPATDLQPSAKPTHGAKLNAGQTRRTAMSMAPVPTLEGGAETDRRVPGSGHSSDTAHDSPAGAGLVDVPGYQILSELGRGGMGVVYKARQKGLNRLVALKMILAGAHASKRDLVRFSTEAESVARLQHPHIVQIHEIGQHDGLPYFSLEYVDGGSLADRLQGTPLPPEQVPALLQTMALAMHAAHQHGIIHRDLKPANVLMTKDGQPKITDFGLAKKLDDDSGQTREGAVMGTPSYMAPEQAEGKTAEVTPVADVYALGAILYEMLTGRPPFKAAHPLDTIMQVISEEPVPPRRLNSKVNRDLETICLKCLQKDPQRRYSSAEALADDLRRFRAEEPILARPVTVWERSVKWARRRPAVAALYAVSVLAFLGLMFGTLVYQHQQKRFVEKELQERLRLDALRNEVQDLALRGQEAVARAETQQQWQDAQLLLASALARIGNETSLDDQRQTLQRLLDDAQRKLADQAVHQQVRTRYQAFRRRYDDALFREALLSGLDLGDNLAEARTAAVDALAQFPEVEADGGVSFWTGEHLEPREKTEVVVGSYELLVLQAGVEAQATLAEKAQVGDHALVAPPHPPAGRAQRALKLLDRASLLSDLPAYQRIHHLFPIHAYHLQRAQCLNQAGDRRGADEERRRALAHRPASAADHYRTGESWYRWGDTARAIPEYRLALQQQPDHFWSQYFLGLCYLKERRLDAAEACFSACLSRRPDFVWTYLLRGFVYGELRQDGAAETDYQEALRRAPDANAQYGIHVNRGVLRVRQKRYADAVADFQQAIALKPRQYQAYVNLAEACQQQAREAKAPDQQKARLAEALQHLDQALRLKLAEPVDPPEAGGRPQPALAALYRTRARLHRQREDLASAQQDLNQAMRVDPPASLALAEDHLELARLHFRGKSFRDSAQACEAALKIRPDLPDAHRLRASALLELERTAASARERNELLKEALASFERYMEHGKPQAEDFRVYAWTAEMLGRPLDAVDEYGRSLALEPENPTTWAYRGWAYLAADAPRPALRDFEEAIRLDAELGNANNGDVYNGRGFARVKLGQFRQGVADAEEAVKRGPRTARLHYNAARVFAQAVAGLDQDLSGKSRLGVETRLQYHDRALTLLRTALEQLPPDQRPQFWRSYVQGDAALAPIRRSSAFGQLASTYARAVK